MKKLLKVVLSTLVLLSVLSFCSLQVFAATDMYAAVTLTDAWYYAYGDAEGYLHKLPCYNQQYQPQDKTQWALKDSVCISITRTNGNPRQFNGFGITLSFPGYVRIDPGYYFVLEFDVQTNCVDPITPDVQFSVYATDSYGIVHHLDYTYSLDASTGRFSVSSAGKISNEYSGTMYLSSVTIDAPVLSSTNQGTYNYLIYPKINVTTHLTLSQKNHQEILEGMDSIQNGWTTDSNVNSSVSDKSDQMGDAESDALGGKSDQEIQQEIAGVLSGDGLPSVNGGGVVAVANTFDLLLDAFGKDYQALLILALTLGLAAVLVGRSFRARGD